jgi:hypothetical protein
MGGAFKAPGFREKLDEYVLAYVLGILGVF